MDFRHKVLNLHKELSATDLDLLQNKVAVLLAGWDEKYASYLKSQNELSGKALADQMTSDADGKRSQFRSLLRDTLSVDDTVDWDILKDKSKFKAKPFPDSKPARPREQRPVDKPGQPEITVFQKLFGQRKKIEGVYARSIQQYEDNLVSVQKENLKQEKEFLTKLKQWESNFESWSQAKARDEAAFLTKQAETNLRVDGLKARWMDGEPEAVIEHAIMVLDASDYRDLFQKNFDLMYDPVGKLLLIEYQLPVPDNLPSVRTVRFTTTSGELKETLISEREKKDLYEEACYQICLRTIHEIFEADSYRHLEMIVFNGIAQYIERSSGNLVTAVIMSLMAGRDEFMKLNLEQIDPKACFKSLKGVSAGSLIGLAAIPPVMKMDKSDRRFIDARTVDLEGDGTTNLASMSWEDFEHLVRELFEKEFASRGGEVKVTQSSRDGGVDAIAFDPDPITGGKIVIQAKRYTKTVGVAAVRDLYGTTLSEGASKGILVTTADYGPDAYKFANGKPITLLTGANLLHLLEKHGVRAKIDLRAARLEAGLSVSGGPLNWE